MRGTIAIDRRLESWGRVVLHHPGKTLALTMLLTAGLVVGLGSIRFDTSMEAMLRQDDPVRAAYDAFRTDFISDERILLVIGSEDIFSFEFLEKLRALHGELERALPHVEEVTSLVNARWTHGEGEELVVQDFLEQWPEKSADLERIRERAHANPLYRNALLSADGRHTVISIRVSPDMASDLEPLAQLDETVAGFEEDSRAVTAPPRAAVLGNSETAEIMGVLLPIVERHSGPSFQVRITGAPPINYAMGILLRRDMQRFTSLAMLGVAFLLFAFFRRLSGVVLPLGIVILSLVGTAGFMGNADLPVTAASQILPSLLLAVGIGFAVHLLTIFYQHLDRGSTREEALVLALGHSGLAIILTGLTTAGSLFSFFFADLAIISDFGLEAPFGVLLALVYTLGLLPALLAVVPIRARRPTDDRDERAEQLAGGLDRVLVWLGDLSARRPASVLAVWTVLLAAGVIGAAQLRPSHMPVEWIPEDNPYRRTLEFVNRELHTSMSVEVIADSGEQSGLSRPDVLRAFEEIKARVMTLGDIPIGNVFSVSDIVKETNQALHSNDATYYSIPEQRPLVAQELLLFEQSGPDELAKMADGALRRGRLSILLNYVDALEYKMWVESLREEIAEIAPPFVGLEITGRLMLMARGIDGLLQGMFWSYTIALLVIVPLMMVITGGVGRGLACMVPNVVPIVVTMGVMFGMGIPLDVFTILIGSICIGVAVDDTIHFVHNFRRDFNSFGDGRGAVRRTLLTTGRALFVTSLVLSSGFVVFAFAGMENVANFGILTSFTVATAFLADVTLLPAVLILLVRRAESAARNTRDVSERVGPSVGSHASTGSMTTDIRLGRSSR